MNDARTFATSKSLLRLYGWLEKNFELSRGGPAENLRPMEGLRGLAVFLVFLFHYVTLIKPWIAGHPALQSLAGALGIIGITGVDLFFILSGYLIYGSLISRPYNFSRFISRRIERIYPTFLVVFVAYVFLSFAFPGENKMPAEAGQRALYLAENLLLLPGIFHIEPMITVAWSLSYEMFFYLATPLLIALFALRSSSRHRRAIFFAMVAASIVLSWPLLHGHIRLVMFVSGILLYEAIDSSAIPTPPSSAGLLALILGLLSSLLPIFGTNGYPLRISLLFFFFFVLCLACFRAPASWLARRFSSTPLRWFGNMSYSYYLIHGLALKIGFLALAAILPAAQHGPRIFWALMPVMFLWTLVPASVLFLAVERPLSLSPRRIRLTLGRFSPQYAAEADHGRPKPVRRFENK
jgi:peptidoglycan/LPS O-acetylase OafA/YrhL